ncbi:MAG: hypothetical protein ACO1RX_21910 [Candidatus Sericytochromatia bacterium]
MPLVAGQELTPLAYYKLLLEHVDYATELLPVGPQQPYEQLLVALETLSEEAPPVLRLHFLNDALRAAAGQAQVELEADEAHTLQFFLPLALKVTPLQRPETAYLLLLFNHLLPLGAAGLDGSGEVFLSYALVKESPEIHGRVVAEVVEQLAFFAARLLPALQAFLSGQRSFAELEAEWLAAGVHP